MAYRLSALPNEVFARKARRAGLTGRTNNIAHSDLWTRNSGPLIIAVVRPCEECCLRVVRAGLRTPLTLLDRRAHLSGSRGRRCYEAMVITAIRWVRMSG